MESLKGNCLIGQSGGPTSVINASTMGCVQAALKADFVEKVYGASHGIKGILNDELFDLTQEDPDELVKAKNTPGSVLGTCRHKLKDSSEDDSEYRRILEIFKKYNIRYFFYNGGNDSMDTCSKVSSFLMKNGYECRIIGIPKTIDNDLNGTDHCPGYGSAAKYVATACMEVRRDATGYDTGSVTVLEIMGRNAGWLAAAAALAAYKGNGPDLVYLPEIAFDMERFVADVKRIYAEKGDIVVAVSEGIRDKDGKYITEYFSDLSTSKDAFGHAQMGGLAGSLANYLKEALGGAKARGIEFNLLQRCAAHCASATDVEESYKAGETAFLSAAAGVTDKMVAFQRGNGPEYTCEMVLVDLAEAANVEKKVPREWINEAGNGMNRAFIDYALPLIQGTVDLPIEDGLPAFAQLKKVLAK